LKWTSALGVTVVGRQNKLTAFAAVREAEDCPKLTSKSARNVGWLRNIGAWQRAATPTYIDLYSITSPANDISGPSFQPGSAFAIVSHGRG
jgi:hypothetical protein